MTDRELLELAARAAGIPTDLANGGFIDEKGVWNVTGYWNPLTDPGDALRLAVELHMDIAMFEDKVFVAALGDELVVISEPLGADPLAATCRAITRAAAEIGKGIKP